VSSRTGATGWQRMAPQPQTPLGAGTNTARSPSAARRSLDGDVNGHAGGRHRAPVVGRMPRGRHGHGGLGVVAPTAARPGRRHPENALRQAKYIWVLCSPEAGRHAVCLAPATPTSVEISSISAQDCRETCNLDTTVSSAIFWGRCETKVGGSCSISPRFRWTAGRSCSA